MRSTSLTLCALVASGCVAVVEEAGDWEPVDAIDGALGPEVGVAPTTTLGTSSTLRIATWNVHFGADCAGLARHIRSSEHLATADVLLVQEIEAHPGEPMTRSRCLAEALEMGWIYAPARVDDDHTHGIAILSRHGLAAPAVRRLAYFDQPINPRTRIALAADVAFGEGHIRIVNVHLDVRLGPVDRVRQLHDAVNDVGDTPLVVGGDFNTNPWAWFEGTVPLLATEAIVGQEQAAVIDDYLFGIGFAGAIPVETPTMRLPALQMRTDDLYARDLRIVAAGVDYLEGSDHWAVWFDVSR